MLRQMRRNPADARRIRCWIDNAGVCETLRWQPVGLCWSRRKFGCVRTDFRRIAGAQHRYGSRFGGNMHRADGFAARAK